MKEGPFHKATPDGHKHWLPAVTMATTEPQIKEQSLPPTSTDKEDTEQEIFPNLVVVTAKLGSIWWFAWCMDSRL